MSGLGQADILAQPEAMLALSGNYDEAADAINLIEWIRRQLYDLRAVVEERDDADEVLGDALADLEVIIATDLAAFNDCRGR